MRRILLGLILIILYGSLFPWHFVGWPQGAVLEWPHRLEAGDALVNILLYLPLGACAYSALSKWRFVAPVALAFLLSTSIELLQAFVPTRVSSAYDISTNVLGAAIGMMLAAALPVRPSPETFLLACWAAHLLFFASPGWPAECVGWLIVASAAMPQRSFRGRGLLAAGCYLVILYRGLSPFRFASAAGAFNWIPFDGFLLANWEKAIPVLVAKMFWYGAAVWVLRRIGLSWMMAGLAAAVFLGAIEVAQRRIPQHVSEITDPLMAVLLAGTFAAIPAAAREEQVRC